MSSGGGDTTTVQQADPWSGVQPYLKNYYDALNQLFLGVPQGDYYSPAKVGATGETIVPSTSPSDIASEAYAAKLGSNARRGYLGASPSLATDITTVIDPRTGSTFTEEDISRGEPSSSIPGWLSQPMIAPISPVTELAQKMMIDRALGGGLTGMAQGAIAGGLEGISPAMGMYAPYATGENIYENPLFSLMAPTAMGATINPYLNQMFGTAAGKVGKSFQDIVMPSIASRYGLAGRTGSGAEQQAYESAMGQLGETLGGLASDIYGRGYEAERARQIQAAGMLGQAYTTGTGQQLGAIGGIQDAYAQMMKDRLMYSQLAPSMAYADISPLFDIGGQQRAYQQELIDAPLKRLQSIGALLQPGLGFGSQTTTTPYYTNPAMGTMGGAMAGYQMGGPWGALIGAGLGYATSQ